MRLGPPALCLLAAALLATAQAGAQVASVEVLDAPDVVVTSASRTNAQGTTTCGDPCRPFSPRVLVRNQDSEPRSFSVWLNAHVSPPRGECAIESTTPVHLFGKTIRLDPGASSTFGGATAPQGGSADPYWPSAIYRTYGTSEGTVDTPAGPHTFCVHVIDQTSGTSRTCPAPCVRATASFEAYVRTSNEAPFGSFTWAPLEPTPGREVTFQADVADNDTTPRPDALTVSWDLDNGDEPDGRTVRARFGSAGTYTITMTVSDGFDTTERTATLIVRAPDGGGGDGDGEGRVGQPFPWLAGLVASVGVALLRRRTR